MGNADKRHEPEPCPTCGGTGCPVCKGTGVASERVGRWGRGYRQDERAGSEGGPDERVPDPPKSDTGPESRAGVRPRWRRPSLVVVGFAALGLLLFWVGIVDGPLSGLGLGFVAGVVVWGLSRLVG